MTAGTLEVIFFFSAPNCCLAEPVVTWGTLSDLGALAHSRPSWRHSVENQQVLQESCFQPLALHPHPFLTPAFRTNVPPGASLPFSELELYLNDPGALLVRLICVQIFRES